jgi:hypothetical protein
MRKAKTLLAVYLAYMLEYRAELFLWALAGLLPLILMGVWTEAARSGGFPLSSGEFARYFLMVFLVRQATVVWVVWEFERDVVEGRLSFRLLRPLDPFLDHLAAHVAERLARLPFVVLLTLLFFYLFPEARFTPRTRPLPSGPSPHPLGLLASLHHAVHHGHAHLLDERATSGRRWPFSRGFGSCSSGVWPSSSWPASSFGLALSATRARGHNTTPCWLAPAWGPRQKGFPGPVRQEKRT